MNTAAFTAYREKVVSNCARVIVGKEDATEKILVSFLCGGHVLLEDKPGTGKTMLLRAFARTVGGDFKRVQFTPDLLPSDLTGINFYNQKSGEFEFRPGPLFTNFVLADEINRATPRTQSALLEAMEERQITVDGVTSRLVEPFMVLATQNPLESFGTFPLPDAQMDRFFMRLSLGYMTREQELEVLSRPSAQTVLNELQAVVTPEETAYVRTAYREVKVSEEVKHYLMDIVEATRTQSGFVSGVSTRGALALYQAAQAYALLAGQGIRHPRGHQRAGPGGAFSPHFSGQQHERRSRRSADAQAVGRDHCAVGECGMSAVIFALLLVATALGLERYSTAHSLDDVQGRLEVENHLVEAGEPAVIHLVVRNSGPRWKMFLAAKLHLNKEFLPCAEHHITQDQAGLGHTVRFTTWLRPGQEADFSTALRLERRGRYVLEPMQVIGGDFLGLVEQSRTERGFHELIVPPRECALPELEEMLGGFLGELSVNRYLYEDPILTAGYRPYTSGDPMRSIAWKQSVRGQGLMVKKWDYTTEPRAVVLVHADTKDYDHPEPAELCYSMARTVCRRLEEKAVSYRFAANAAFDLLLNAALSGEEWRKPLETPQGYGPEHYRRVLEILGRATGQTALSCARFCAEYYHPQEQVSCIVVTTEPEEAVRAAVRPLPGIPLLVLTPEMAAETAQTGEAGA